MDAARPIIIKKKKAAGGDGHHGGAWKVAYADFVTAMMAFFLLMWLLNATSEEQRKGLADFFDPSLPISRNSAGGAGMLDGDTVFAEEKASGSRKEGERPRPIHSPKGENLGDEAASPDAPEVTDATSDLADRSGAGGGPTSEDSDGIGRPDGTAEDDAAGKAAQDQLEAVGVGLVDQIIRSGDTGLMEHFALRTTPEGLVIEIVDIDDRALFNSGATDPDPVLTELIGILAPVLARTTNDIAVVGHTDATPFGRDRGYTNWELSADRANTARRMLADAGLPEDRVVRVSGRAATNPIAADPYSPSNRRIAITLLREPSQN